MRERRFFVDSSAYLGILDVDDAFHAEAGAILAPTAREHLRPYTTNVVIFEAHALILSALGIGIATRFLDSSERSTTVVIRVRAADEERAKSIIRRYRDKDFSFTDALSFAAMERLGITQAFTSDRHFSQYGFMQLSADALRDVGMRGHR